VPPGGISCIAFNAGRANKAVECRRPVASLDRMATAPAQFSYRWIPAVLLIGAVLARAATVEAGSTSTTAAAWRELAAGNSREARASFLKVRASQPTAIRETQIGEAVALLNLQPVTATNREAARRLCAEVATANPEDAWTLKARYFLGRISELHTTPTDLAGAATHYEWLFTHHPASEWGQLALVKFAIVQLQEPVAPDETHRRYHRLVTLEPKLAEASARRDFHLVLGATCLQHDLGLEEALRHLLAAEAAGVRQPIRAATVLIQIAELSRKLGRLVQARTYYERFLAVAGDGDTRSFLVRERLAAWPVEVKP